MDPSCANTQVLQVQHLVAFIVGFTGQTLKIMADGIEQILLDVGDMFTDMSDNCTLMAQLTTGIFGDNGGLIYWINEKILHMLSELF